MRCKIELVENVSEHAILVLVSMCCIDMRVGSGRSDYPKGLHIHAMRTEDS